VTLLKAAVIPLVFTAVVASISNLSQVTNAARLAVKTLIWFAITAFFAVSIGIVLGLLVQPGVGAEVSASGSTSTRGSWTAFLTGIIPSNFLGLEVTTKTTDSGITSSVSFNVLQMLVISGAIGIAALKVGDAAKPFIDIVKSALAIIQKVLWWIIRLAPLGTIGLIGHAVYAYGWTSMGAGEVHCGTVCGSAPRVPGGVSPDREVQRALCETVLLGRMARSAAWFRIAVFDGHYAHD